jgi:hypothetical protein
MGLTIIQLLGSSFWGPGVPFPGLDTCPAHHELDNLDIWGQSTGALGGHCGHTPCGRLKICKRTGGCKTFPFISPDLLGDLCDSGRPGPCIAGRPGPYSIGRPGPVCGRRDPMIGRHGPNRSGRRGPVFQWHAGPGDDLGLPSPRFYNGHPGPVFLVSSWKGLGFWAVVLSCGACPRPATAHALCCPLWMCWRKKNLETCFLGGTCVVFETNAAQSGGWPSRAAAPHP